MRYAALIKRKLGELNASQKRLVDLFRIMHDTNGLFCQQIRERHYVQELSYIEIKRRALNVAVALSLPQNGDCLNSLAVSGKDANSPEAFVGQENRNCQTQQTDSGNTFLGLQPDGRQRIGIKMPNCFEFVVVLWGVILSGNVPVLINTEFDQKTTDMVASDLQLSRIFEIEDAQKLLRTVENKVEPLFFDYDKAADEIVLTTTGATGNCKYCFYNGKSIANFLNKTPFIAKKIPQIIASKNIKHLAFLPLFHIFGLFAVYFWFGFFGQPFLFVDNIFTDLMQNIRSFKVTHIFAVPLLFRTIRREIYKKANESGRLPILLDGLEKSFRAQSKLPLPRRLLRKKFSEVTSKSLGTDVCFMISGGAPIDEETLRLFNCMGYDLHTGYGTTEVGITSLCLSPHIKNRCRATIGQPLPGVTYRQSGDNLLEIASDTAAFRVIHGGNVTLLDDNTFYFTNDRCIKEGDYYTFEARDDEIIAAENGENYNLCSLQSDNYGVDFPENYCFIPYKNNVGLIVSVFGETIENTAASIEKLRSNAVLKAKRVTSILITEDPLPKGLKLINHREVVLLVNSGKIVTMPLSDYTPKNLVGANDATTDKLLAIVARALDKESVSKTADLFLELGCTSFDYYVIMQDIAAEFSLNIAMLMPVGKDLIGADDIPRNVLEIQAFLEKTAGM